MGIKVCPRCQQRFVYDNSCEDIIHNCGEQGGASEVLRNEDIKVKGDWEDYTGSNVNVNNVNMQGITNNIWGQRGWLEGDKVSTLTSRGNDVDIVRTRKHEEFIKLKGGQNDK